MNSITENCLVLTNLSNSTINPNITNHTPNEILENNIQNQENLNNNENLSEKEDESKYAIGRWTQEEHQRFIEAILKYGNEWKNVQKHVMTRSSTQARSHAQKFFMKIKKTDLLAMEETESNNSIKHLHKELLSM